MKLENRIKNISKQMDAEDLIIMVRVKNGQLSIFRTEKISDDNAKLIGADDEEDEEEETEEEFPLKRIDNPLTKLNIGDRDKKPLLLDKINYIQ